MNYLDTTILFCIFVANLRTTVFRIQTGSWTDQSNQKRYFTEVVADEVGFVDSKPADGSGATPMRSENLGTPSFNNAGASKFEEVTDDDNLPF